MYYSAKYFSNDITLFFLSAQCISIYSILYVPFEDRPIIINYIIAKFILRIRITYAYKWVISLHVQYQERGWYNQTMSNKRATQRRERARNLELQVSQQIFLHISWEHLRLLLNVAKCEKGKLHHERKSTRAAHKS